MANEIMDKDALPERARLRKAKIAARDALSPEERAEKSRAICRRVLQSPVFQNARTVLLYRAVKGEVSLEELRAHPDCTGKRLVFPLCVSGTGMEAVLPGEDAWETGRYGIPEPIMERSAVVPPADIDLVLCPCTAFDEGCGRMGMGGGFYDRYLPRCGNAAVAAVAFEVQKAAALPTEDWDRPMDLVFTEDRIYRRQTD